MSSCSGKPLAAAFLFRHFVGVGFPSKNSQRSRDLSIAPKKIPATQLLNVELSDDQASSWQAASVSGLPLHPEKICPRR